MINFLFNPKTPIITIIMLLKTTKTCLFVFKLNIQCTFQELSKNKQRSESKPILKHLKWFAEQYPVCSAFRTANMALISLQHIPVQYSWAKQMDMPTHFSLFDLDSAKSSLKQHLMESDSWLDTLLYPCCLPVSIWVYVRVGP